MTQSTLTETVKGDGGARAARYRVFLALASARLPSKLDSTFVPVCTSKFAPPYCTRHDAKARRH